MIKYTAKVRRGLALAAQLLEHEIDDQDPRPAAWIIRDWPKADQDALKSARAWMKQEAAGEAPARIRAKSDDPALQAAATVTPPPAPGVEAFTDDGRFVSGNGYGGERM